MHVGYNLLGVQEYDQVLRKECESVNDEIFLSEPDRAILSNSESGAKHSNIHVGEFMRVSDFVDVARASDLGRRRTNHSCVWMQCM
jgi:hypothetical protein